MVSITAGQQANQCVMSWLLNQRVYKGGPVGKRKKEVMKYYSNLMLIMLAC